MIVRILERSYSTGSIGQKTEGGTVIDPDELIHGQCYFLLLYYHPKIDIPMIRTLIYIGKNVHTKEESSEDEWYFQDPESYLEYGSFLKFSKEIEHETLLATKDSLYQIFDLNGLIEELGRIKNY